MIFFRQNSGKDFDVTQIRLIDDDVIKITGDWKTVENQMGLHWLIDYFIRTLSHEIVHLILGNRIDLPVLAELKKPKARLLYVRNKRLSQALDNPEIKGMVSFHKNGKTIVDDLANPDIFDYDGMPRKLLG